MKYIIVALSGAADHPCEELGGKTPFEVAKIPNLHHFARSGRVGQVKLFNDTLEPASDISFMNLLGYDAQTEYTGLGPLEAANMELELEDDEIPFRMNFITESGGQMADATAGNITNREARALINFLNKKVSSDFVRFHAGHGYRHVAVIKDAHGYDALSARTHSPDTIEGQKIDAHFPKGPGAELLKKMMYDAKLLLQDHEVNQVRVDLKENPANMIWLWGQGRPPVLESFKAKFGLTGAVVAGIEFATGLGRVAGMDVYQMPIPEGNDDAEAYERKGKSVLSVLDKHDVVCVQVQTADEASRRGDLKAKISAIEAADFFILSRIRQYLEQKKDVRVCVTPCHATPWKLRKHVRDMVPFAIAGKNIRADDIERFTELAAGSSEMKIQKSTEFMPVLLAK